MKLETAIKNAYQILKKKDIKTALLDSEILLSVAINKSREYVILNSNLDISDKEYIYYQKMVNQRSKGKPIAYLTEKKFFWKYEFYVNEKVLIPRPDTEIIVEQVLKIYKNKNNINFLDIGFGSGCILLSDIELQEVGMKAILDRIPDGHNYYLTIDADGVDPTIMPAVAGPAPGGVNYSQMRTLIQGLVKKGRVLGMDIVEITPSKDVNGITAITAGRFICNLIGSAVRAGYFKK